MSKVVYYCKNLKNKLCKQERNLEQLIRNQNNKSTKNVVPTLAIESLSKRRFCQHGPQVAR